jgi:hypothetical protein
MAGVLRGGRYLLLALARGRRLARRRTSVTGMAAARS